MSTNSELIRLVLDPGLRVAGEEVKGEVYLDFAELQKTPLEEIHVKLRGTVLTYEAFVFATSPILTYCGHFQRSITRQIGQSTIPDRRIVSVVREDLWVWTKGTVYPAAQENILKLPFSFVLPENSPLSCEYRKFVGYSVEVIGVRAGILHRKKRITQTLPVLPHNALGAELRDTLRLGWGGRLRSVAFPKKIRKSIWGEYSDVLVNVSA